MNVLHLYKLAGIMCIVHMHSMNYGRKMANQAPESGSLIPPFSLEQFQEDLIEVYVHHICNIGRLVNVEAAWALLSKEELSMPAYEFLNPEASAKNLGFTFATIAHTEFAKAMINLYNYAFFGRLDTALQAPEGESEYVWYTTLCCDAADSPSASERFDYGSDIFPHANRCVQVAETANARNMLEGEEPFYYFHGHKNKEASIDFDGLTIRQLALLSGMEEGSVRAAMNPKRAKPLVTFKSGSRTLVNIEVAKEWLLDKGRYIPMIRYRSSTEIDWKTEKIESMDEFISLLVDQLNHVVHQQSDLNTEIEIENKIEALGISINHAHRLLMQKPLSITHEQMRNTSLMKELANVIQVAPDIFALRAEEAVLCEEIQRLADERKRLAFQ